MTNSKNHFGYILLIFLISVMISCSSNDEDSANMTGQQTNQESDEESQDNNNTDTETALVLTDVSYGPDEEQVYDLYLPAGRSSNSTKILVLIHGGGWTSGDKDDMQEFVTYFLENHPNHAILNLNYVLAQVTGPAAFPNQYLDIEAAISQITQQSESLQVLPEFGFLGTSAGAHLSMMYDYIYDPNNQVKFVINIVGPSDLTDPFYSDDPNFVIALALLTDEDQYPAGTDFAVANSPALIANENSSPTLLFYGNQDPIVPLSNGQTLSNALSLLDIEHTFTIYEGGHGDDWSDEARLDLTSKTDNYIDTYLAVE